MFIWVKMLISQVLNMPQNLNQKTPQMHPFQSPKKNVIKNKQAKYPHEY